ncbi:hypothetical protein N9N67_04400 [Bacteriovoracaceae bacterium]|nr:hypothetical protein [Bacteriovoracaceae bacterium]
MNKKYGSLTLIPTPISEQGGLTAETIQKILAILKLDQHQVICEEPKASRRRWLRYGLPREEIEQFEYFNEHNASNGKNLDHIISRLKKGTEYLLFSDCGLPGFCDPGQELVSRCHDHHVRVRSTTFYSSPILALALSGFGDRHLFHGFLAKDRNQRKKEINQIINKVETTIIMDTPYRLNRTMMEFKEEEVKNNRQNSYFIGINLNEVNELCLRGSINQIIDIVGTRKDPFILIKQGKV